MYRLLWRNISDVELAGGEYATHDEALASAKTMCQTAGHSVVVMVDVSEVQMLPSVVSLAPSLPPPGPVYRGAADKVILLEEDLAPRVPQAKPRLLVVDRRATPAEIFGHLMVVAEGRIVKNAFGALELGDMPLVGTELKEVTDALQSLSSD